jgi:hypothetical protein
MKDSTTLLITTMTKVLLVICIFVVTYFALIEQNTMGNLEHLALIFCIFCIYAIVTNIMVVINTDIEIQLTFAKRILILTFINLTSISIAAFSLFILKCNITAIITSFTATIVIISISTISSVITIKNLLKKYSMHQLIQC